MSLESKALPAIPAKRYFTIGEVSELCGVKAYVLRYWEQEFTQLKPMKRRGNRRYYQHHEVLLIRRIRDLLYEQGFTISGARNQLTEVAHAHARVPGQQETEAPVDAATLAHAPSDAADVATQPVAAAAPAAARNGHDEQTLAEPDTDGDAVTSMSAPSPAPSVVTLREELLAIRALLVG
jgi:DNA-binding transcriptional MerR regulator